MYNLTNISVQEFYSLTDEALAKKYLRFTAEKDAFYLKPRDTFAGRRATPLGQLTYGEVSNIKHNLANPTFESIYECFELVFQVNQRSYLIQRVTDYFYALNWIKAELRKLIEGEMKSLGGGEVDPVLETAGVHRLIPFGELNTLIQIAERYGKSPAEVENWKYNLVFSLMLHSKVSNEVQKNYNELKYGSQNKA